MTTTQISTETLIEISNELSDSIYRAKKVGYKNIPPRLPKKHPTVSTMSGFKKRFKNWSAGLLTLEIEYNKQTKRIVKENANLLENYTNK